MSQVLPDADSKLSKKAQVAGMFDGIAQRYDLLNHLLSLGIDKGWRRTAIREVAKGAPTAILDVATGTGDLAIAAAKKLPSAHITGVDISTGMLDVGRKKLSGTQLYSRITLQEGDSEALPFAADSFDAVIVCVRAVRNFEHLEAGLKEMARVLRPGGRLVILEFSKPKVFPVAQLYKLYFSVVLPLGRQTRVAPQQGVYLPAAVGGCIPGRRGILQHALGMWIGRRNRKAVVGRHYNIILRREALTSGNITIRGKPAFATRNITDTIYQNIP